MKNKIKAIMIKIFNKVYSIIKTETAILGSIFLGLISIIMIFNYVNWLHIKISENKNLIYYVEEKKKSKEHVWYLDKEIRSLYKQLENEVDYNECINNQLTRVLNDEVTDFEYCEDVEFDEEDEEFMDDIIKDLLWDE